MDKHLNLQTKKDRTAFTSSAQVYGRAYLQKTTEIVHFKNAPCTIGRLVASSFTALRDKSCESGART